MAKSEKIDRKTLVSRHNIVSSDVKQVIPVGNGNFCFSCDVTGLQTFGGNTMSHWAWHSFPLPPDLSIDDLPETGCYMTGKLTGKGVDLIPAGKEPAADYMFHNPHSFNLGRLRFIKGDGGDLKPEEVTDIQRRYDLWSGILSSSFMFCGELVKTTVCVHPHEDTVAVHAVSELLKSGKLSVALEFPYPALSGSPWLGDFSNESSHVSNVSIFHEKKLCRIDRKADEAVYSCTFGWNRGNIKQISAHCVVLNSGANETNETNEKNETNEFEFVCRYSVSCDDDTNMPSVAQTQRECAAYWARFWGGGGAVDLSGSTDKRWIELERRIVLSQYILAVQSAGSFPSAEAGLMNCDGWCGQFHMEMTWWHIAHYALWNRMELADKQLSCYQKFFPIAKKLAAQLGYKGAKWGKMVGPEGRTAPWGGNLALLWKQPHPIFFAELEYKVRQKTETLKKWAEIVEETAVHMADYAVKKDDGYYHLDPVMPPSELGFTYDTVFDIAYWRWGLQTAQLWRQRMGFARVEHWDTVADNMAPLPEQDGVYIRSPEWTQTYTTQNYEHPDPVGIFGMLPPIEGVNRKTVRATLKKIWETWQKNRIWGWDYPWIAMCAARIGEPDIAIDAMLSGDIDVIGANGMGSYPYLPANGGILYAAAMMAVGRDGEVAPGFLKNDMWNIKVENILGW